MDKALRALLSISSCTDLVNALEIVLRSIELGSTDYIDFDNTFKYMFQEFKSEEKSEESSRHLLPDYIYILLAILSIILGEPYVHRFALRFSKHMLKVLRALDDENIVRYGNTLDIRFEYSRDKCYKEVLSSVSKNDVVVSICFRYRIPLYEYLRIARRLLTEQPWKLSSQILDRGYIYIDSKDKVLRLIAEYVYSIISAKLKDVKDSCESIDDIKSRLLALLQDFNKDLAVRVEEYIKNYSQQHNQFIQRFSTSPKLIASVHEIAKVDNLEELVALANKLFPPCIYHLINMIIQGENLSHHQRFALATFLINLGIGLDLILRIFSFSPDYNEKIARYQIEHLAGLRGSKKKYLVYSCNTMKTLGMCKAECNVRNPLTYVRRMIAKTKDE